MNNNNLEQIAKEELQLDQGKKLKISLRKKLFLMIVLMIIGLLFAVYTVTLNDEQKVLSRELKIRGGTVARNIADSIYLNLANLIQAKRANPNDPFTFDPHKPGAISPMPFIDAMQKASEQQDFISGFVIDPKNRVFVHSDSDKKRYLFNLATPKGIYDFKAMFPIRLYLQSLLEKNKTDINSIKNVSQQKAILNTLLSFKDKLKLVNKKNGLTVFLTKNNKNISLEIKHSLFNKKLALNLKENNLHSIGKIILIDIYNEFQEARNFINNTAEDFRKLRREAILDANKEKIKTIFIKLENILNYNSLYISKLAILLPELKKSLNQISNKNLKKRALDVLNNLYLFSRQLKPIVQVMKRKTGNKKFEEVLYITYPMCEIDKYFKTYRGEIHLQLSKKGIIYTINNAESKLQLAAFIAILVGTIMTIIMSFFITNPLKKLMHGMQKVGEGDLEQTVNVRVSDEIGVLAYNFNEMTAGLREKEKIRKAMNKAVSKDIAEEMLSGEMTLGGSKKLVTCLFSDIRGFTTLSEALSPEGVVELLNEYMTIMTNIVEKHQGIVDKFVGDEIMAIWGAPKRHDNDELAAIKAAIEMIDELDALNIRRTNRGQLPIDIGIGLNTGDVIAGNMGSESRMNYTVLGDSVNLAARLEGTNKIYKTNIIISEYTYEIIKDFVYTRELDLIRVKGKTEPVLIFEVVGLTSKGEAIQTITS